MPPRLQAAPPDDADIPAPPDLNDPRVRDFIGGARMRTTPPGSATSPPPDNPSSPPAAATGATTTPAAEPHHDNVLKKTFSMPQADFALLDAQQTRALRLTVKAVTASQVIRAGINLLARLDDDTFLAAFQGIDVVKPGPRKR